MDADTFNDLALRVIAGEATADERRALETEFASIPSRRDEFDQLRLVHEIAHTVTSSQAVEPQLPTYRLNELRTAVRQHFGPAKIKSGNRFSAIAVVRWIFVGGGALIAACILVLLAYSDRSVEIGLYQTSQVRGEEAVVTPEAVPSAHLVTFDQDSSFADWQNRPLAWNEHAKIWIDDEHDQLHIVRRGPDGKTVQETQPLASGNQAQRAQIQQVVESISKR
ncbi:MAG: hypothetical protein LV479_10490 [Methylacidiphilales bacterium]|nr:hypothetical protein [Candidatus Methylacidiphilales bacterium]